MLKFKKLLPIILLSTLVVGCSTTPNTPGTIDFNGDDPTRLSQLSSITEVSDGDFVVIGNATKNIVASTYNNGGFTKYSLNDIQEITTINEIKDDVAIFQLRKSDNNYKFVSLENKLLSAQKEKELTWGSGSTTWNLSFDNKGNAVIENIVADYGKIMYNTAINKFKNYKSSTSSTMLLPQLYLLGDVEKVYPTNITISGTSNLYVGDTATLSVAFEPSNTNQKKLTWTSSNTTVATVNNGEVTALKAGNTTITASIVDDNSNTISDTFDVTVSNVAVQSITFDNNSKTIGVGKSFTLTPIFTPSNATNKNVTWSSTNTSVASVNNGKVTANAVGTTTIKAISEDGNKEALCEVEVVEQASDAWTIMVYLCGSDLESGTEYDDWGNVSEYKTAATAQGYASGDLDEILKVSGQPEDVNIIVETGGAHIWQSGHSFSINEKKLERWHVRDKKLVKDATLDDANMGESDTLKSFLTWGLETYPAERTGLILWNHGGAMKGVCYDENHNDDTLTNKEVKDAVAGAFSKTGQSEKLEFIGYDACLMAVQDLAEFNSEYFNYMIASEESEAGEGWDYDTWIDDVYAGKSTTDILKAIVDGFIATQGGPNATTYHRYTADQTLSYYDLSKMSAYKTAWENMATQLSNKVPTSSKSSFNSAITSNVKHFADTDYDYFCTFDAKDFVDKLASSNAFSSYRIDSSYTNAVLTALAELIPYNVAQKGAGNAYGIAMFWPNNSTYSTMSDYTLAQTNFTNWQSFCSTHGTYKR